MDKQVEGAQKSQAAVLINARGFFFPVFCGDCGELGGLDAARN